MTARAPWLASVLIPSLGLGCAERIDDRVRTAWGGSSRAPTVSSEGGATARDGVSDEERQAPVRIGWDRVDQILDGAVAEASLGTDDEVMARLADRWCASEPSPLSRVDGVVRVCRPDPPVQIDSHAFTLELGGEGVIGLVANGLSAAEASALADEARLRTDRWCTQTWIPEPADPPPSPEVARLYTCAVEGSAMLAVGHFFVGEADQWQVSVAVIDAS